MKIMLYIGAVICFGLFSLIGNGIMEMETVIPGLDRLFELLGWMNVGLGVFSGSVLVWMGWRS